jgi:glycyl-tRNA synthetase beta chain
MSLKSDTLLLELGTEELPAQSLIALSRALADGIAAGLTAAGLGHGASAIYATPRRLACRIHAVDLLQPERRSQRRGPALSAAYDAAGNPTRAALGFATSCGVAIEALGVETTDKGSWLSFNSVEPGLPTARLLPAIVQQAINALPLKRRMRWGAGDAEFLRPVHWVVLLLGEEVIPTTLFGLAAGRETRGHAVHAPAAIRLDHASDYPERLEANGQVIAGFAERRERIESQVQAAARAAGAVPVIAPDLLDEVTGLVEWPVAILGSFNPGFLALPPELLVATLRDHQKYFHCVDTNGALMPHFVTVANIASRDPEQVRRGNERVVRPRLEDAAFFWSQDVAEALSARLPQLEGVVFQRGLGSLKAKTLRMSRLAGEIATRLGLDAATVERAAQLSRCDLLTGLVGEFPELQGIIGGHLALATGESATVAAAIGEFYRPRHAGDELPATPAGQVLALADRLDTLVACFSIGAVPSGDKDPYALRRTALGAMRILIEARLPLDLAALCSSAAEGLETEAARAAVPAVFDFCFERLRSQMGEEGTTVEVFDAVLCRRPTEPGDFTARVAALSGFLRLPEAASLTAANKRIANLLKKVEGELPPPVAAGEHTEAVERELALALSAIEIVVEPLLAARDYTGALTRMAALRAPVDAFFDGVMVMADDPLVRSRRLSLLKALQGLFLQVADFSRLPGASGTD